MSAAEDALVLEAQIALLREEREALDAAITTKQAILADLERRIACLTEQRNDVVTQLQASEQRVVNLEARLVAAVHEAVRATIPCCARSER